MIDSDVKKCVENGDFKGLRYIFLESLDVDPTFESYEEDFAYCKDIPGLFEAHRELTPLAENQQQWDDAYWVNLKMDMKKNFSLRRFEHMKQVARVVNAEKITRLTQERKLEEERKGLAEERAQQKNVVARKENPSQQTQPRDLSPKARQAENQEKQLAEKRRKLDEANRRTGAEEQAQKRNIAQLEADLARQNAQTGDSDSKKVLGVVLVAVAALVIIIILIMSL